MVTTTLRFMVVTLVMLHAPPGPARAIGLEASCRGNMDAYRSAQPERVAGEGKATQGPCQALHFANETVTKYALRNRNGTLVGHHHHLWQLETSVYEKLNKATRPRGCEPFVLFPKLLQKDEANLSLTTARFGQPIECKDEGHVSSSCCGVSSCMHMQNKNDEPLIVGHKVL